MMDIDDDNEEEVWEDAAEDDPDSLLDESAAVCEKRKAAVAQFNRFLVDRHEKDIDKNPYTDLATAGRDPEYMTEDLLKKFVIHLTTEKNKGLNKTGRKYNTVLTLCSTLNELLREEYKMIISDKFVSKIRRNLLRRYTAIAKLTRTRVFNQAPPLKVSELKFFCHILMAENSLPSFETRAALVLQWQCMGRVWEAASFFTSDFSFCEEVDSVSMKVSSLKDLL